MIRLQAMERFVNLFGSLLPGPAVNFGHDEGLLPVAIAQRLAHTGLALAAVVIPGIVEEIEAAVQCGSNDANGILLAEFGFSDVEPAQPQNGYLLTRPS